MKGLGAWANAVLAHDIDATQARQGKTNISGKHFMHGRVLAAARAPQVSCRARRAGIFVLLIGTSIVAQAAGGIADCARELDNDLRLRCYDALSESPVQTAALPPPDAVETSGMSRFWELDEADKQGTFVAKTYLPNFLMPVIWTSTMNRAPSSPTHPAPAVNNNYKTIEAKLQISLRSKVVENLLLPGADLWLSYTQRSLWQLWDRQGSAPFRSTDYQPEAIYVVPVPIKLGRLPMGWRLRMLQFGISHQSNGQGDALSRSINQTYLGAGFERRNFSVLIRAKQRLRMSNKDDNPDLVDYVGRHEIVMAWTPGQSTVDLSLRTGFSSLSRGSLQVDWTHPVFADRPLGLRWYAQIFSGYGETLLDYNHRQTRLGLGLTLFQF